MKSIVGGPFFIDFLLIGHFYLQISYFWPQIVQFDLSFRFHRGLFSGLLFAHGDFFIWFSKFLLVWLQMVAPMFIFLDADTLHFE